jgi:hypothetical protein
VDRAVLWQPEIGQDDPKLIVLAALLFPTLVLLMPDQQQYLNLLHAPRESSPA